MSEFWTLVEGEFGPVRGRMLVHEHVLGGLGHRTSQQALDAGEEPRTVWFALCDDLDVPTERRWGVDEQQVRQGRRGRSS